MEICSDFEMNPNGPILDVFAFMRREHAAAVLGIVAQVLVQKLGSNQTRIRRWRATGATLSSSDL